MENFLGWHMTAHIASLLTVAAYLLKDILWLRLLTILSCVAGIAFNYFVPATPLWTVIYWNVLFAIINIVQIAIIIKERSGVHFTEEEKELHDTLFKNFAPFEFMKLMRIAKWREAKQGETLSIEKQQLDSVMLIYNGLAAVDYVTLFAEDTPYDLIRAIEPDVLAKGSDWAPDQVVGRDVVEARGGRVLLVPVVAGFSTTTLLDRLRSR